MVRVKAIKLSGIIQSMVILLLLLLIIFFVLFYIIIYLRSNLVSFNIDIIEENVCLEEQNNKNYLNMDILEKELAFDNLIKNVQKLENKVIELPIDTTQTKDMDIDSTEPNTLEKVNSNIERPSLFEVKSLNSR